MSAVKITEGIYSVGIMNPNMRVFDIVMKTDSGTSYNSYLVRGSEKTALIETCHESFFEEYLENIKEVCKFEEIDYIVMNHNEPDHSGSLAKAAGADAKRTADCFDCRCKLSEKYHQPL